uniref:LD27216p (inferred by orthology to a D. melanogaster protein) n=1 Tax=Anisakis simplex TaxID=6269 RepID=A0A0M3J4E7_ANISI
LFFCNGGLSSFIEAIRRLISDAGFELITQLELPERSEVKRDKPLKEAIVLNYKQRDGSYKEVNKLKSLIFRGGLEMALRRDLWNFLLGVFGWEYTHEDIVNVRFCVVVFAV